MERTHSWAKRSLEAHRRIEYENLKASLPFEVPQGRRRGIYGIVQGGRFEDLRLESARTLAEMDFDGYGIGGSFSKEDILGILEKVNRELPEEKPRHLLGIGEPEDLFIGVAAGIDTFDCVLPTRNGRNGTVYTFSRITSVFSRALRRTSGSQSSTAISKSTEMSFSRGIKNKRNYSSQPILDTVSQ